VTGGGSSIPEVQRLLGVLVASKPNGKIAEIGTAFGEGAKAILDALGPDATFVTVEPDVDRYAQAAAVLEGTRAEVLNAGWEDVLPERGPFDLIFFDGGTRGDTLDLAIGLLAPGGILVKDDLTPGEDGLAQAPVGHDALRQAFLEDERLVGVELLATTNMAVIVATRRTT
jgi:predicted O-methyltransferase YrrM